MTLPLPRFVDPASVDPGDTIRATWTVGDVEHSRVGTVHRIHNRTMFTADGQELCRYEPGASNVRYTLLRRKPAKQPALF